MRESQSIHVKVGKHCPEKQNKGTITHFYFKLSDMNDFLKKAERAVHSGFVNAHDEVEGYLHRYDNESTISKGILGVKRSGHRKRVQDAAPPTLFSKLEPRQRRRSKKSKRIAF